MSKAQKLVNRALEILQRRRDNHLNDQKALTEIRGLIDRTEDDGMGTASEKVKLARKTMQQHHDFVLNDHDAVAELGVVFGLKA
jgi:hypothetical protein